MAEREMKVRKEGTKEWIVRKGEEGQRKWIGRRGEEGEKKGRS